MSTSVAIDPKLDFAIERFIDAPRRLVWEDDEAGASQGVVHAESLGPCTATRDGRATGRHLSVRALSL